MTIHCPAPSPLYQGITVLIILTAWHYVVVNSFLYYYLYMSGPSSNPSPICGHHRHHQHVKPNAIAPSPSKNHGNIHLSNWLCLLESLFCSHTHLYYKKNDTEISTMKQGHTIVYSASQLYKWECIPNIRIKTFQFWTWYVQW